MKKNFLNTAMRSLAAVAFVATLAACNPEKEQVSVSFTATTENPSSDTKVHLQDERWIYWDINDEINAMSDADKQMGTAVLVDMGSRQITDYDSSQFNGVFVGSFSWDAKYFVGLHPKSDRNVMSASSGNSHGFSLTVDLPTEQPYKDDNTFNTAVFPMVAWYGGTWSSEPYTPFNLDFHSLAGIVRLQFFSSSSQQEITSISVTETTGKQIAGKFDVSGYYTWNPKLVSAESDKSTITITNITNCTVGQGSDVKSFFLVLPSVGGSEQNDQYKLQVKVNGTLAKTLTVSIRRNGIAYVPALDLADMTSVQVGLTGNGTQARPFKIYSAADMTYLASCFNNASGTVYVNGQEVSNNTQFRIMRSDIVLPNDWSGIDNFKGQLRYIAEGSTNHNPGITNNSAHPIFNSIAEGAVVEGLTVRTFGTLSGSATFSPFCTTNSGTIRDCHILSIDRTATSQQTITYNGNFAGLCVTNSGTLDGCGNSASMTISGNIGGVCYTNNGTIQGCFAASPMKVNNSSSSYQVGGVVYENSSSATVQDCYFAARAVNSNNSWGGIVHTNNGGTVKRSYISRFAFIQSAVEPAISTNQTVGGIVNTMSAGAVDYCWAAANLNGNAVGGIVATLSGGQVKNCFADDPTHMVITALGTGYYAGGLVGNLCGGTLANSYASVKQVYAGPGSSNGNLGGAVGVVTNNGVAVNCYCYQADLVNSGGGSFYGANTGTNTATLGNLYVLNAPNSEGNYNTDVTPTWNGSSGSGMSDLLSSLNEARSGGSYSSMSLTISGLRVWTGGDNVLPTLSTTE